MNQKKANAALFEEKIMNLLGKQLKGFSGAGRSTGALVGAGGGALAGLGGTALGQLAGNDSETNASGKMDSYLKNALRGAAVGAGAGGIAGANMGASRLRNFVRKGVSNAAPRLEEKMLANPAALEELKSHIMSQPGLYQPGEGAGMIENMFQKKLQANRSKEMIDELRGAKMQATVKPKKPVVENMENMGQRGNVPRNTKKQAPEAEEVYRTYESDTKLDKILRGAGYAARKTKNFVKNAPGRVSEAAREFRKGFNPQKNVSPEASVRGSSVFDEPSFMRKVAPEAKAAPKPENPSKSFEELVKERQMPSMVDAAAAKIKKPSAEPSANILRGTQKSPEDMKKSFMSSVKKEKTPEQVQKEQKTQQAQEKQEQRAQRMDSEETGRNQTIDDIRKFHLLEKYKAEQRGDSRGMLDQMHKLLGTYSKNYSPKASKGSSKPQVAEKASKGSKKNTQINNPVIKEDDSKLNDLLARIEKEKQKQEISTPAAKPAVEVKPKSNSDELAFNKEPNDIQKNIMRVMSNESRPIEDFKEHPDLMDLFD